jgi:REP element-mobilizing transposase RayT
MAKQQSLFKDPRKDTKAWWVKKKTTYGGALDYRKTARPFDSKLLTHAVFKANVGTEPFTKNKDEIKKRIDEAAEKSGVKIMDQAIALDHIHLFFDTKRREDQARFFRILCGSIGLLYKKIRQKLGLTGKFKFWLGRPFTRLVSWGQRSIQAIRNYFQLNRDEAMGSVPHQPRRHPINDFLEKWRRQHNRWRSTG